MVANACTDDTAKIARETADKVIEIPEQGISNAKNLGAKIAEGQIYTFVDADSIMEERLLEQVYLSVVRERYTGGKAKVNPLDDDRFRAYIFCRYCELLSRTTKSIRLIDSGAGAFIFTTNNLYKRIEDTYGQGFRRDLKVMEDVDFLTKVKKHGKYKFITKSCLYTSMRRFVEEGYVKCFIEDLIHVLSPKGKTRKRWNQ